MIGKKFFLGGKLNQIYQLQIDIFADNEISQFISEQKNVLLLICSYINYIVVIFTKDTYQQL